MLNNLKMDVYRMVHQKSFYVTLILLVLVYTWLLNGEGLVNNTSLASFDRHQDSLTDFLFYFPKSMFFIAGNLIYLVLFCTEEYSSGFTRNVFPIAKSKWMLLAERYLFTGIVYLLFWLAIVVMTIISSLWATPGFTDSSIWNYALYMLLQLLLLQAVGSFLMLLIHAFRNKVFGVVCAILYGATMTYMIHAMLSTLLPDNLQYYKMTLVYITGTLPTHWVGYDYGIALLIALSSALLYGIISAMVLKRKDVM